VPTDEGTACAGRLVWGEERNESIGSVMDRAGTETDRTATSEAAEWLEDTLSAGIMASSAVKEQAKRVSITVDALKRACKRLNVVVTSAGFPRRTYWELPDGAQSAHPLRGEQLTTPTAPTSSPLGLADDPVGAVGAAGAVGGVPRARKPTRAPGAQTRRSRS